MIDYLTDVQPLEATMTDAEIASVLSASTSRDIQIADLENFLDFEGLAARNAITGSWEGPLPDEIASNANGLSAGLSALFNHINKPRSVIVDTTVSPWAEQAFQLTSGLIAAGLITSAQQDSFYDLGGGRPNPSLTSADVATCRSDWVAAEAARQAEQEAEAARQAVRDRYWQGHNSTVAPVLDSASFDKADVIAAMRAAADEWEAEA